MNPDPANLDEQLQGIRRQLASLQEKLTVVAERQILLYQLVSRLHPPPANHHPAPAEQPTPVLAQEVLAECAQDLLRVLREVSHPLTLLEILTKVVQRQLRWRESTIRHALTYLIDHGLVRDSGDAPPHRYHVQSEALTPTAPV
jgi:hypothetical protein